MTFIADRVRVSVPATCANLGPGFDSLGLALDLRDEVSVVLAEALTITVEGEGETGDLQVPLDETHLVHRAFARGCTALGVDVPPIALHCRNVIPHSRGLGSSSAAIVAGVALARGLVAGGAEQMSVDDLFALAADIEGHPDNVAPATYGGFTISWAEDGRFSSVVATRNPGVLAAVLIPPDGVETKTARGLLPQVIPHSEAAANSGRTALLVAALAGRTELLLPATNDLLHQSYRRPAMPATLDVVERLRGEGVAAVVSGAGPTVLVLGSEGDMETALTALPDGWRALRPPLDGDGLRYL